MSNQQHTPGPWEVRESKGDVWVCPALHRPESGASVNSINGGCSIARFYGDDARCNGRLAAAAPELLEALKALYLDTFENTYTTDSVAEAARVAIAKATGAA